MNCKPYIVGYWRADPKKELQYGEFRSWAAALEFCKANREKFCLCAHFDAAED